MASPEWLRSGQGQDSFGFRGRNVSPADTDLAPIAKSVVMLEAGDITVVPAENANSATIAFSGLPAGYIIPFRVRRVTACTGTCATID